jgi:hypothetical protein
MASRRASIFLFCGLLCLAGAVFAQEPGPHPRLYITREGGDRVPGLAEMRRRLRDPAYAAAWQRVQASKTSENLALVVLLTGDTTGLPLVRKALSAKVNTYGALVERSLAFDWAYDAFGKAERKEFARRLLESADAVAQRYQMNCVYHNYTRGQQMGRGMAMLAAWGEVPAAEQLYPTINIQLKDLLKILGDGVRPDDMEGRAGYGGGWPEGYDYDRHGGLYALELLLAWRSAGLGNLISGSDYWRDKILWLLYGTTPDGKVVLGYEDNDFPFPMRHDREMMTALAAEFGSGYARWWIDSYADTLACRPYWDMIFSNPSVRATPPNDLPTARLVRGVGLALLRSSWGKDAAFVHFHCGPWYTYHQHAAQGSFTAYRGRPLLVEPGVYDGEVHEHYVNWRIRTISHNCLTVLDPEERFHGPGDVPSPANDGGQVIQNWTLKPGTLEEFRAQRKMRSAGQVTVFLNDPSHDLVTGEAAGAYAPGKVKRWCRQLLYLKPGWLVVCDLASARADFAKTLYFHTPEEIALEGGRVAGKSAAPVQAFSLLPAGASLRVAGGPGRTFEYGGRNWTTIPAYNSQCDLAWRLEVEAPREESTVFLTAIYLPDPQDAGARRQAELVESTPGRVTLSLDGVYRVSFDPSAEKSYELTGPGITYSVSGAVFEGGLPVGGSTVSLSGRASRTVQADNHGRYLFDRLSPGDYTVKLEGTERTQAVTVTSHSLGGVNFE